MLNEILVQLKPWLAWLHLHPYWVGIGAFVIAFVECLALVGLVVPGTVIMTALGAMIGSHVITAKVIFIPAMLGAFLGDVVSFSLGFYYREHLRDIWPFKFYPRLLQKGESFFYRHGGKGIFVGRFIGPIRPMLPMIAGMLNMPPWRFLVADAISAVFWAPLYTLPGILLGAASAELAPDIALHLVLYVILILLILWCVSWLIKRLIQWMFAKLHDSLDRIWSAIKHKPFLHPLHIALQDPLHPESHAQLTLGLYFILIACLFGGLSFSVIRHGLLTDWNHPVLFFMQSLYNPAAAHIFLLITIAASPIVWLSVFVVLLIWFLSIRAFRTARHWGILGLLSFGGIEFFKHLVHSPRPWGLAVTPAGYSFPSGHTALTAAFLGFLAVLIARELPKHYRWISYLSAVLVVLAVVLSRLYLRAHWLTDTAGGVLFAMAVVMLVTLSYRRKNTPRLNPVLLIIIFIISFGLSASLYGMKNFQKLVQDYTVYTPAKTISLQTWWNQNGSEEPLYRLNRLGKPAQILNLQWAGDLDNIQKNLLTQGWVLSPHTTFGRLLNRMGEKTKKLELPVVPQLYLDKRPVMLMTKLLNPDSLVILTLWSSGIRFSDTGMPLWLGNISYYHIWQMGYFHLRLLNTHKNTNINTNKWSAASALLLLQENISHDLPYENYTWKQSGQRMLIMSQNGENS